MQNYNLKLKIFLTILTFTFSLLTFNLTQVSAQQLLPLQVSPARQQISLDPGQNTNISVKFFNLGETPLNGIVKVADFIVTDNSGTVRIIDNPDQASPKFSGSAWINLSVDEINIAPTDKTVVTAKINVPADAKPGGRYVALYFEPGTAVAQGVGTSPQQAGTTVSSRIAGLIYIKVNGPITENASVFRMSAPSFLEYGPINLEMDIINRGDYHVIPRGLITLTNMVGDTIGQQKIDEQNIFPDSIRTYQTQLGKKWMFGRYTISFSGSYGDQGKVMTNYLYVWVFPIKVALALLLVIIILVIILRKYYMSLMTKSSQLEKEVEQERKEIEKLKKQLTQKME